MSEETDLNRAGGIVRLNSSVTVRVRNFGCLRVAQLDDHQANREIMLELKGPEQRLNK